MSKQVPSTGRAQLSRYRGALIGGAVLALTVLGAGAANAANYWSSFDVIAPRLQQPVNTSFQTKANSWANADVQINTIGASYHVNLRTVRDGGSQYGAELFDVGTGSYSIDSPFAAGAVVGLQIHNSTWTGVNVQVTGAYKGN